MFQVVRTSEPLLEISAQMRRGGLDPIPIQLEVLVVSEDNLQSSHVVNVRVLRERARRLRLTGMLRFDNSTPTTL